MFREDLSRNFDFPLNDVAFVFFIATSLAGLSLVFLIRLKR
jgi:hypothetical protein